ncbi:hypothetical protein N0V93_009288 [Gnomoniopsis smithogilvyi]|uniref:Myosin class II heavy chain n=1 Tax=Gnomoniopsis smithogilvyi TaxID=1191159 RepID=A0A9W8YKK3_9PEZI|nr:hypothetical protein N0V93_009288 [Gnomoniopsis smithogilvyi]
MTFPGSLSSSIIDSGHRRRRDGDSDTLRDSAADDFDIVCADLTVVPATTSSSQVSSPPNPPRATAQDGLRSPASPALSTASTADDDATSSPFIAHLQAPLLPKRALELLRTPPAPRADNGDDRQFITASWGSPYPQSEAANFRAQGSGSEPSDGSPLHRLELDTPFLRPAPYLTVPPDEQQGSSLAAILVNRARRLAPARGLTEDWIRQHTAADENVEPRHWLSDGSESEHSSLSGSQAGDEAAWLDDKDLVTPKANTSRVASRQSSRPPHPRARSSTETLKQSTMERSRNSIGAAMANFGSPERSQLGKNSGLVVTTDHPLATPDGSTGGKIGSAEVQQTEAKAPVTPTREAPKKEPSHTPRVKKRVPWRGKSIMVLLPKDDDWGRPGGRPSLMKEHQVANMFREWEELGYDTRGFDLNEPSGPDEHAALPLEHYSRSRDEWPDVEETRREWAERKFKVTLPDIDAWKRYVDELTEAKLRALGVSLADEEPPPPPTATISPNPSQQPLSRRATITQYPPLPFSPPIPTSSASSQGLQQFPFPGQPTPGSINAVASPTSFGGGFNPQQQAPPTSMPNQSAFGFMPPQPQPSPRDVIFQQQGMHRVSPSLSTSPFGQGAFQPPLQHQRHQSLQFPQLPHQQFMPPTRSTPQLQEVREEEEEEHHAKSASKTPEPGPQVRHNSSDSLQREIDEAEYHLEEQFRSQLEHDQDYSPHNEDDKIQKPIQDLAPQAPQFENTIDDSLVLHHPRPHSRGHSLTQKYFGEEDMRESADASGLNRLNTIQDDKSGEEIETNPSNLGTPAHDKFPGMHDRTFSNPWQDVQSTSRRPSLDNKPPLSKFNVAAPEFKFNPTSNFQPTSTFQPGQFNFGSNTFQPAVFQGVFAPAPKAPESVQSNSSKINVNAPVFSPGSSEFSFSAAGAPTFRPDAPAFVPLGSSVSGSVTSPILSGSESGRMPSIFGSIDLTQPAIIKPPKASKAIPIVRPSSRKSDREDRPTREDENGRIADDSKPKRFRGASTDMDEEVRFADQPVERVQSVEHDEPADKDAEDERPGPETAMSSTIVSDSTDTSALDQPAMHWAPVNLRSETEISDFNAARPFGEDFFATGHPQSLSAKAKPLTPGTSIASRDDDKEDTPIPGHFEESALEPAKQSAFSPVNEATEEFSRSPVDIEPSPVSPEGTDDQSFDQSRFVPSPSPENRGLMASRFAALSPSPSPIKGLSASKYARSPSTPLSEAEAQEAVISSMTAEEELEDLEDTQGTASQPASPPQIPYDEDRELREPTFEEIDEVMRHINEDPSMGVNKLTDATWHQQSPARPIPIPGTIHAPGESPKHVHPRLRHDAPSPAPRHYHLPIGVQPPLQSTELEDPFVDPPLSAQLSQLNTSPSQAASDDWERAFSDEEQLKLDHRAGFFDGRVNDLVDGVLEHRFGSLQQTLNGMQKALAALNDRTPPSRRERRSVSAEIQESDADDEDDDGPPPRRSMSPRKDRRLDQIKAAVAEALNAQQRNNAPLPPLPPGAGMDAASPEALTSIFQAVEEMKQQFNGALHLDFRGEDLRNVVEEAIASRLPASSSQQVVDPKSIEDSEDLAERFNELSTRYADLEQRLRLEEAKNATEISTRRIADDRAAELERHLHMAETRLEAEITNRSLYDQRVVELEDKLKHQEDISESEVQLRRAAEDRLAEIQRLLRISSEEEIRLRDTLEEKDERLKIYDATNSRNTMRLALLEASVNNLTRDKADLESRVNIAEEDARDLRQEANRWRLEAERNIELSGRQSDDLHAALDEKRQLHVLIDTLGTQLNENERVRESWRTKFLSLQEDMERATFEIAEENGRRAKKEQTLLARQEVLDAKLQAESRTRERLEVELERLEAGERQGMKAVNEAKRLEALLGEMRTENHKLQQTAMRYQAEFEEARESGAREVQRARESMQHQLEEANHQVNFVRETLEDQISNLQAQLDQAKLDADTVRSQYDMLSEGQHNKAHVDELVRKHQDEMEDMQARFERQLNNTMEDAQRLESNLLERLSISTSKCEHLQDRVAHLEEKLDIAREAARAAAQAARTSGYSSPPVVDVPAAPFAAPKTVSAAQPAAPVQSEAVAKAMQLPEKISPQALRESIMVLQEQLQEREQKIEALEQIADPEAETKIAKRDDEIVWLRELLGVRHSDLQDIITALGRDDYDQDRVRDAAIRLKANLQMEQQERERAMNGGSAITLPNIAASLRDATPRVAQAVGPFAAALGNWRKGGSFTSAISSSAAGGASATPQKRDSPSSQSSFLSGLLTPPQSNLRPQTPGNSGSQQPTAFSSTGRRFTPQDLANRPKAFSARQASKMPARGNESPLRNQPQQNAPQTPPMMRSAAYDDDALAQDDFDDAGFFDDE